MKKTILGIIGFCLIISTSNVNADEAYYVNNNGLSFTEFQYKIMAQILYEEAIADLTADQYKYYGVSEMTPENTKVAVEEDNSNFDASPNATFHETSGKRVSIATICHSTYCRAITTNTWKVLPKVRSYDVVGFRLANTNFVDTFIAASLVTDKQIYDEKSSKGFDNGVGVIFKLPSNETIDTISVAVNVEPSGRVYSTYQHSVKSITLDQALNFSISSGGLGSVLKYPSSYNGYFDEMAGVYIAL